ncbi:hypothetical protein Tco_0897688 [Tanacetum coccineum]
MLENKGCHLAYVDVKEVSRKGKKEIDVELCRKTHLLEKLLEMEFPEMLELEGLYPYYLLRRPTVPDPNKLLTPKLFFAPIPKSDKRFARQYRCGPPPDFPLASPCSGIVYHLSGDPITLDI